MKKLLLWVLIVLIVTTFTLAGCKKVEEVAEEEETVTTSAVIGPSGGIIEVADSASPLYGAEIEIPEGALEGEVDISISIFSKSGFEKQVSELAEEMRFFGGIQINAEGTLKKGILISIPNSFGATSSDQLLVGQVIDLDSDSLSEVVYRGTAQIGSPIKFNISDFGIYVVLSPTVPQVLVRGDFVDQSDNPVSDGVVISSFSDPLISVTDSDGDFEIPAGQEGSYTLFTGISPSEPVTEESTQIGSIGITGVVIPPPDMTDIPTSGIDVVRDIFLDIILGEENIEGPPTTFCTCDPSPLDPVFTSVEDPEPPFELLEGQTIQTYLLGFGIAIKGPTTWPNPLDLSKIFGSGSLGMVTEVKYWAEDESIAIADSEGRLTAVSQGDTKIRAKVQLVVIKVCETLGIRTSIFCPYTLYSEAKVIVNKLPSSHLVIHVHNPEGIEIASIAGMEPNCVEIYDGDTLIEYGAHNEETHNKPIEVSPGTHTIKVKFNGMTKEQVVTVNPDETEEVTFIFDRRVWDFRDLLNIGTVSDSLYFCETLSPHTPAMVDLRGPRPYPLIHLVTWLCLMNNADGDEILSGDLFCDMDISRDNMTVDVNVANFLSNREVSRLPFNYSFDSFRPDHIETRYHSRIFEFESNPPQFDNWYIQKKPTSNTEGKAVFFIFPAPSEEFPGDWGFPLQNASTYDCFYFPTNMIIEFFVAIRHTDFGVFYWKWDDKEEDSGEDFRHTTGEGKFTNDQVYVSSVPYDITGEGI
jgi:hypothetical protein